MTALNKVKPPVAGSHIHYLAGYSNYTWFYLANGGRQLKSLPITHHAASLPGFIRIHKGYLVNPEYVLTFHRTGPYSAVVRMLDGAELPISRRRLVDVRTRLRLLPKDWFYPCSQKQRPVAESR